MNDIKLLVLDVDGVLTDGGIVYTADGQEIKRFDCKDGAGLKYWRRAGGQVAWITGRASDIVSRRAQELGVDVVRQGIKVKRPVLEEVFAELGVSAAQTAVIGDDLPDLPMMYGCGFSAAPADAVEEVASHVDYVCRNDGGRGCVREVIELLLKKSGKWASIMERYLPGERE